MLNRRRFLLSAGTVAASLAVSPRVIFAEPSNYPSPKVTPYPNYSDMLEGFAMIEARELVVDYIFIHPDDRQAFLNVFVHPNPTALAIAALDPAYDIPLVGFLHGATVSVQPDLQPKQVRMVSCPLWPCIDCSLQRSLWWTEQESNPCLEFPWRCGHTTATKVDDNVMTVDVHHNNWLVRYPRPEYVSGFTVVGIYRNDETGAPTPYQLA